MNNKIDYSNFKTFLFKNEESGDMCMVCEQSIELAQAEINRVYTAYAAPKFKHFHGVSPYNKVGCIYYGDLKKDITKA